MFAGAEVTSTGSGMAFTTWPDAYGRYLWPDDPTLGGILEHTHRLLGALLGVFAILLVLMAFVKDRRPMMKKWAIALLVLICIQGLLGGYRVLLDKQFPVLFPVLHGTLAHFVFSVAGVCAYLSSMAFVPRAVEDAGVVRRSRKLAIFALVTVVFQITLGVILRHTDNNIAKWTHISFAAFAAIIVLVASAHSLGRFGKIPGFTRTNRIILVILAGQTLLGFVALVVRRPKLEADTSLMAQATVVSCHVVLGACLMLAMSVLVARSYNNLMPRSDG